jgi:predicted DNA repair protein MutK
VLSSNNLFAILWWGAYTIIGVWVQKVVPGVDILAPGIILSMQEEAGHRTLWLAIIWILLLEGIGSLPFGYGVAWYGLLVLFYSVGRWLFEARSLLFMALLGVGLGVLHPILIYSLSSLGDLIVPVQPTILEGLLQAVTFPVVWLAADQLFPKRLRQDVKSL